MADDMVSPEELPRVAVTVDSGLVARLEMAHELIRQSVPGEVAENSVAEISLEKVLDAALAAFLDSAIQELLDGLPS